MRFNRAAKVAAFPLLALVLVVALIACQGPAGPPGPAATAVPGTTGTTGPRGDDALEAHAIAVVIFNQVDSDEDADTTKGPEVTIDLNMHLTGGVAEGRKFQIVNTFGWIETATGAVGGEYLLTGSMLKLSVPEPFTPGEVHAEDALVLVEAMDTDGESAVLYVKVRGNIQPARGTTTEFGLVVGTQPDPAGDGDKPDYFDMTDNAVNADDVTCAMLNACAIDLTDVTRMFSDGNLRDSLTYKAYVADNDDIRVKETATGVEIMGLKGQTTPIPVIVWAVDDGLLPMNRPDDTSTMDEDETETKPYPPDARIITINVTVDRAPYLSDAADGAVSLSVDDTAKEIGNVFDEGITNENIAVTYTPALGKQNAQGGIAEITEGTATTTDPPRVPILVNGINPGTITLTVKAAEMDTDDNVPDQYAEHMITVTVTL